MNSLALKLIVILLIVVGEAFAIYAEIVAAKDHSVNSQPFLSIFLKMFLVIAFGSGLLIIGYMLGFRAFQDIWVISVTSITSILMVEPVLAYAIFRQYPTTGEMIGLVLGASGFAAAMLIP